MAKGSSSSTPAATADPSEDFPVFIDTNLDTHLAMIVTAQDTIADFKRKVVVEHPLCFPDVGEIAIHAMKVWRKSCFYHLSDAMLVRSAFYGSKRAWYVHVDASSTRLNSANNETRTTEISLRSENGEQLKKSHLVSLEPGVGISDSQAVQTHSPALNGPLVEENLLQPGSDTLLVEICQKPPSCDPLVEVPSVPDDLSLPQVGSSIADNPQVLSSNQDRDASNVSNSGAKIDSAAELGASLDIIRGLDPKVPKGSDLVNDGNEVLETHIPSKDDFVIDQRDNYGRDKESAVDGDEDRPPFVLINKDKYKKRSRDLQLDNSSTENLQEVAKKKRRKGKEKDVFVEPITNPSEDVRDDAGSNELSKLESTLQQTPLEDEHTKNSGSMVLTSEPLNDDYSAPQNLVDEKKKKKRKSSKSQDEIDSKVPFGANDRNTGYVEKESNPDVSLSSHGSRKADAVSSSGNTHKTSEEVLVMSTKSSGKESNPATAIEESEHDATDRHPSTLSEKGTYSAAVQSTVDGKEPTLLSLSEPHDVNASKQTVVETFIDSLVGARTDENNGRKVEENIEALEQTLASAGKKANKSKKKRENITKSLVKEAEFITEDITPLQSENATIEVEMADFGDRKGKTPKKSRAVAAAAAAKSHASRSGVEYVNNTEEVASMRYDPYGLDNNDDGVLKSRQDGIDETKKVENASSQTEKETLKTSRADNANGNEVPISGTEGTANFRDEKGKRKSKKSRSSKLKSVPEPLMELQGGVQNTLGDLQNLDIHQTDGNKKEENAVPRRRYKLKSDRTSSKNQLSGSMLEGEESGVRTESSQANKTSRAAASVNGSQDEANNHDINFKEFFVPKARELGDTAQELAAVRKPHERTSKRAKKSNVESKDTALHLDSPPSSQDQSKHKKKPKGGNPDTIEFQGSSSKDEKSKHAHHRDNGTSVVAGESMKIQPDHLRDNFVASPNGPETLKSKIGDGFVNSSSIHSSAVQGTSKVSVSASEKENQAASSPGDERLKKTIHTNKLVKKLPLQSNQYRVAYRKVLDKNLGEVLNNSDREKSLLGTSDSIFKYLSDGSSEDEGEVYDSDATTNGLSDNSSSSADSDVKEKRTPSKTPAPRKRAHMKSPGTGPVSSVAYGGNDKENDGDDISLSQSKDMDAKSRSFGMLLRSSSSYRKAKLSASQSRLENTESQPVDMVPDSQAALPDFPEVHLSQ